MAKQTSQAVNTEKGASVKSSSVEIPQNIQALGVFINRLIPVLSKNNEPFEKNGKKYPASKGVHGKYSGFNDTVRAFMARTRGISVNDVPWSDVWDGLNSARDYKLYGSRPVKGGSMVYTLTDWQIMQEQAKTRAMALTQENALDLADDLMKMD